MERSEVILTLEKMEEFRKIFEEWRDRNIDAIEAGALGDYENLASLAASWWDRHDAGNLSQESNTHPSA